MGGIRPKPVIEKKSGGGKKDSKLLGPDAARLH